MRLNDGLMKKPGAHYLFFLFRPPLRRRRSASPSRRDRFAVVQLSLVTALLAETMLSHAAVYTEWARLNSRSSNPLLEGFRHCAARAGAPATHERLHHHTLCHSHSLARRYRLVGYTRAGRAREVRAGAGGCWHPRPATPDHGQPWGPAQAWSIQVAAATQPVGTQPGREYCERKYGGCREVDAGASSS
jgi:hypothetical protein